MALAGRTLIITRLFFLFGLSLQLLLPAETCHFFADLFRITNRRIYVIAIWIPCLHTRNIRLSFSIYYSNYVVPYNILVFFL